MKTKDILKSRSAADLEQELADKREELRKFRFAVSQSKIKDMKSGREIKRDIARILTRLNQLKS